MQISSTLWKSLSSAAGPSTKSTLAGPSLSARSTSKTVPKATSTRRVVPAASSSTQMKSTNNTSTARSVPSKNTTLPKQSAREEILEGSKKASPIRQTKSFQGEKSFWQSYKDIGPMNQVYVGIAFMLFGGFIWWTDKLVPEEEEKLDTVIERRRGVRTPEQRPT